MVSSCVLLVYSVATDGEPVYFQQIFLGRSVFESVPFQSGVGVDDFVLVPLVRRGQERVRVAHGECRGGALIHVGGWRTVCRRRYLAFVG